MNESFAHQGAAHHLALEFYWVKCRAWQCGKALPTGRRQIVQVFDLLHHAILQRIYVQQHPVILKALAKKV
eukprot:5035631-Karenia_brevis.AAC.1